MNSGIQAPFSLSRAVGTVALLSVLTLTATCVQRAYAHVAAPNHVEVTLNAPSGGFSNPIDLPVNNSPVKVAASTLSPSNFRGTGAMHITYANTAPASITWSGTNSSGTVSSGGAPIPGDDLILCGQGAISSGPALNQIRVHNTQAEGVAAVVVVELIW